MNRRIVMAALIVLLFTVRWPRHRPPIEAVIGRTRRAGNVRAWSRCFILRNCRERQFSIISSGLGYW